MRPSFAVAALGVLIGAAVPTVTAQLSMKVCTDGSCSQGCTSWTKGSGECSPGTSPYWISSITTMSSDGKSAVFDVFQDSSSSQTCSGPKIASYTSLKTDGSCQAMSHCEGIGCSTLGFTSMSIGNVGFVAGIVVAVVIIAIICCLGCCWHNGTCCFSQCPRKRATQAAAMMAPPVAQLTVQQQAQFQQQTSATQQIAAKAAA
jgi:hypothetical protein